MAIVADRVLKDLLKTFPAKYCYAFAYGSAVFAQNNQQPGKVRCIKSVAEIENAYSNSSSLLKKLQLVLDDRLGVCC